MQAILSDIHGNLEALTAVLHRLESFDVDSMICLGDTVGYGPNSVECLRIVSQWAIAIMGDWDMALVEHNPSEWNPAVNRHIEWMREHVSSDSQAEELYRAVGGFKRTLTERGYLFTHGTPDNMRDFLFPEELYSPAKLDRVAEQFGSAMFVGHTHIPGLFLHDGSEWAYLEGKEGQIFNIDDYHKVICNVGSVGQPRDGDPRASFVLLDGPVIQFHRIQYDVRAAISKIEAIPEIDDLHGQRLLDGR